MLSSSRIGQAVDSKSIETAAEGAIVGAMVVMALSTASVTVGGSLSAILAQALAYIGAA